MRIIAGYLKGRRFSPPADKWPTRPTTDFAKEGLYNMLQNRLDFEEIEMLDLFGGTGNHCYEFVSRGCPSVTYVDSFRGCATFVVKTAKELNIESKITVHCMDVFKYIALGSKKFDYIFGGPPYPLKTLATIPDKIFEKELLKQGGTFVLEHDHNNNFEKHNNFVESRNYGTAIFSFFSFKTD